MPKFKVEGMSCAHCERAVTEAIRRLDPGVPVEVDLAAGTVATGSQAGAEQLAQAIRDEGYPAQVME